MTKGFITGISGFVGGHLTQELERLGWEISGLDVHAPATMKTFYQADIGDRDVLRKALRERKPEVIFHLAGAVKSTNPEEFYRTYVLGTVVLLNAVLESGSRPVVLIAGSSAVYGPGYGQKPITEQYKPRPMTHYAASKLAQESVALRYYNADHLPVVCVRTFNLLGPGLSPELACSAFAKQIAEAELSGQPSTVLTGDLSAQRDFVDVRDAVRAYVHLVEKAQSGQVYNVASGRAVSIRECLDFLRKQSKVPIDTRLDPARVQKNDVPIQIGSIGRIAAQTGWKPEISIERSLLDLLNDWRIRVRMV